MNVGAVGGESVTSILLGNAFILGVCVLLLVVVFLTFILVLCPALLCSGFVYAICYALFGVFVFYWTNQLASTRSFSVICGVERWLSAQTVPFPSTSAQYPRAWLSLPCLWLPNPHVAVIYVNPSPSESMPPGCHNPHPPLSGCGVER